jgi:YHS domain-containing protein
MTTPTISVRGWIAAGLMLALTLAGLPGAASSASPGTPIHPVNTEGGVALKGYDPVAYFGAGRATRGTEAHTHRWQGATYRFASADNLERFKADPERYLPRYGGYCAYAMSLNRIADIDPERWAIVDGRLYLNNNRLAHALWSLDRTGHIESADRHWPAFPKLAGDS